MKPLLTISAAVTISALSSMVLTTYYLKRNQTAISDAAQQTSLENAHPPQINKSMNEQQNDSIVMVHSEIEKLKAEIRQLKIEQNNIDSTESPYDSERISNDISAQRISQNEVELRVINLENYFDSEASTDQRETDDSLSSIYEVFESEIFENFDLNEASCSESICKMNVQLPEGLSREDSLRLLQHHKPWDGETFFSVNDTGVLELYFAKSGGMLPL